MYEFDPNKTKKENLQFDLNKQDFFNAIPHKCHYCLEEYHGIAFDRLDSKKGYTLDNIVPCCAECNMMKRNMSKKAFINRCKKIANNFQ